MMHGRKNIKIILNIHQNFEVILTCIVVIMWK